MVCCAVCAFPSPFACLIRAAICFCSARDNLRFVPAAVSRAFCACAFDNSRYLLFKFSLPFQNGIEVFRLIRAFLWTGKLCLNDVLYHDFKGLPVSFIHGKEETGQHNDNHCLAARVVPALPLSKKKSGNPTRRAAPRQTICRFVRLNATLVLILDRSLGTVTYAKRIPPFTKKYCCVLLHFPYVPTGRVLSRK